MDEEKIIKLIIVGVGTKLRFIKLLESKLARRIPQSYSLIKLVKWTLQNCGEKELARILSVPDLETYATSLQTSNLVSPVFTLRKRELLELMDVLSGHQKKWRFSKTTKRAMIKVLSEKIRSGAVRTRKIEKAYVSLLDEDKVPDLVTKDGIVLGPLGFLVSHSEVPLLEDDIDALLEPLIIPGLAETKQLQLLRVIADGLISDVTLLSKARKSRHAASAMKQLLITQCSTRVIIEGINSLLSVKAIECRPEFFYKSASGPLREEDYPDIIMTPHGYIIVGGEDDPPERLAALLLMEYPREQDLEGELVGYRGSYDLKVLDLCLRKSPNKLVDELFSKPRLRYHVKEMGFFLVDNTDNDALIKLLLLGLGYQLPPRLRWLKIAWNELSENLTRLERIELAEVEFVGIVTTSFRKIERILASLTRFYVSAINGFAFFSEYREYIQKMVRKSIYRFSIGDWLTVLRHANGTLKKVDLIPSSVEQILTDSEAVPEHVIKEFEKLNRMRRPFTHHKKEPPSQDKATVTIRRMVKVLSVLINMDQMPTMVRIVREMTNEFGISYIEMVDDNDDMWTVYTDTYCKANVPYLMHRRTSPVVVKPVLVSLSRSDH